MREIEYKGHIFKWKVGKTFILIENRELKFKEIYCSSQFGYKNLEEAMWDGYYHITPHMILQKIKYRCEALR